MAGQINHVATVFDRGLETPSPVVTFTHTNSGPTPKITLINWGYGESQVFDLTPTGPQAGAMRVLGSGDLLTLDLGSYGTGSIEEIQLGQVFEDWQLGHHSATLTYLGNTAHQGDATSLMALETSSGTPLLFAAPASGSGITGFRLNGENLLSDSVLTPDQDGRYLDRIADMAAINIGGQAYLYAGSSSEHGISAWRVNDDASLTEITQLGRNQSLPVQAITALDMVHVGSQPFLIAAAAGTSSLSVMRIAEDGTLEVTDHAIDTRHTRFRDAATLSVVDHEGQAFVVVSGRDDGLSLFTLTQAGRLVHLDSLADSQISALGNVSALKMLIRDGDLEILTTGSADAGLSQFRYDLGELGEVRSTASGNLSGTIGNDLLSLNGGSGRVGAGGGDDLISDGDGVDTLTGGQGQDTFVMRADRARDVITDFTAGEDLLDLSAWPLLRSADQIEVTQTATGALLRYGQEALELQSGNESPLEAEQVASWLRFGADHFSVILAPLQEPEPRPDPEPTPEPEPNPDPPPEPEPQPEPQPEPGRILSGSDGPDSMVGGTGNDFIRADAGEDTIEGGAGNDSLVAGSGSDLVRGGPGDDNIPGKAGNDTIYGDDGNDQLGGSDGFDLIFGGEGHDLAGGGDQNDTMDAGPGDDWFSGGWGNDIVRGNTGDDKLAGSYDDDWVYGGDGNDSLGGGEGRDELYGDTGNDVLGAGEDNDSLWGGLGSDSLGGADGDDVLYGEEGNDTLNGAHGNDTLTGGLGADVFFFNNFFSSGTDMITDFDPGEDYLRLVGLPLGNDPIGKLEPTEGPHEGRSGLWLDFGNNLIFVEGLSAGDLDESHFLF
ncbi:hypothetical protein FDP25_08720 [Roseovarius sp. A21]|uniref:Ca2+-binding protein, RTX toxin-related n=1 Tax=Roseovarius bejariae TaxID=2576383 RepID=A0A844CU07_9RHOB|nr:calcium-binding protein [Roseovarius bejariae]MRU15509.1 hypothetical protein [Roseovarius bejariae]